MFVYKELWNGGGKDINHEIIDKPFNFLHLFSFFSTRRQNFKAKKKMQGKFLFFMKKIPAINERGFFLMFQIIINKLSSFDYAQDDTLLFH